MSVQRFVVRVGERSYEVEVDPGSGDGTRGVVVDGDAFVVRDAPGGVTLVREATGHRQRRAVIDAPARPHEVAVDGIAVRLELQTAQEAAFEAAMAAGGAAAGAGRIEAPMPGQVVKVLVAPDAIVERDDPVMIVEAMKMENELRAPIAGKVTRVEVTAGQAVEAGQLLCEIEAHPAEPSA